MMVMLDLYLSIDCGCRGYVHQLTCGIQSQLPVLCSVRPGCWFMQIGKFMVKEDYLQKARPVLPVKQFEHSEFPVTILSPLKKNAKKESSYFVDVAIPEHAQEYLKQTISELEKRFGQMKAQQRKHLLLTNQQRTRINVNDRGFTEFTAVCNSLKLVKTSKAVDIRMKGISEENLLWSVQLKPVTLQSKRPGSAPVRTAYTLGKQCCVGFILLLIFLIILPAGIFAIIRQDTIINAG